MKSAWTVTWQSASGSKLTDPVRAETAGKAIALSERILRKEGFLLPKDYRLLKVEAGIHL